MLQYMQYINSLQSPAADPAPAQGVPPVPAGQDNGPGAQQEEERGQVMNAGGGGMMEDDAGANNVRGDRDLLDWMYLLSRVVLLFSIVYFYSSITRFLVVAVLAGFVYLYQVTIIALLSMPTDNYNYSEWCIWRQRQTENQR